LTGNIWRETLKGDNMFAGVTTFLAERDEPKWGVFDTRLLSIKE